MAAGGWWRGAVTAVAAALAGALPATAQQRVPVPTAPAACSGSAQVVAIRVVDRSGAPVGDAVLTVRRRRTGLPVEGSGRMGIAGDYLIADDDLASTVAPGGETFDVTLTRGPVRRRLRFVIGSDANRCHVRLVAGPSRVTL